MRALAALAEHPLLNSSVSEDGSTLIKKGQHNIGLAMDTPNGLLVPNVKDVRSKSLLEIAADLQRLQAAASAGKLGVADLKVRLMRLNAAQCGSMRLNAAQCG